MTTATKNKTTTTAAGRVLRGEIFIKGGWIRASVRIGDRLGVDKELAASPCPISGYRYCCDTVKDYAHTYGYTCTINGQGFELVFDGYTPVS